MTILFYDNVATGHHPGYIAGIVAAAQVIDLDFFVASAIRPATLSEPERWIRTEPTPLRAVAASRRQLARASAAARALGADTLIDLFLDHQIWVAAAAAGFTHRVHVLHHAEQYSSSDRTGLARLRTSYLRQRLRGLLRDGAAVVVHTQRTLEILGDVVDSGRTVMAGYPVVPLPAERAPNVDDLPTFLFVGAGRHEKGLDLLFEAFRPISHRAGLRVVGRQPAGIRRAMTESHPEVQVVWIDDYVDDVTLHAEYARAHFAALPYRESFGRHGGPSSVLLETLSAGIPIVTTTALKDQLPPGYRGAVVVQADSASSLTRAVVLALDSREEVARAATQDGPTFVAAHHTFDAYLEKLVSAARPAV